MLRGTQNTNEMFDSICRYTEGNMALTFAIIMASLVVIGLIVAITRRFTFVINVEAFGYQVKKLLMANNVDRAIKLCNTIPRNPVLKAVKNLLKHANRIYSLELVYRESGQALKKGKSVLWLQIGVFMLMWASIVGMALSLMVLGPERGPEKTWIYICMGVYVVVNIFVSSLTAGEATCTKKGLDLLTEVRTVLYLRNGEYLPPTLKPRKATLEEVEAWRESMDGFETEMKVKRTTGAKFDINKEYDEKAGDDGVLPAI